MLNTETGARETFSTQSYLGRAFCLCVLCLAIFQFSENTADPDLWAHVMFGEHLLQTGELMKTDPYSWTAYNYPWINHEVLSEAALGLAHRSLGGPGLLLLKMFMGGLTFGIALYLATRPMARATRVLAWAFGALAVVEISFGFAARPQIFTALALVLQLWITLQIHRGRWLWALALPVLFALWINTHGGALAGIVLLFATAGATTAQWLARKFWPVAARPWLDTECSPKIVLVLWASAFAATASLLINPWGYELVRWLVRSVMWLRPEVEEWNEAKLNWDHVAFYAWVLITVVGLVYSRLPRSLWKIAVLSFLGLIAFRSVRHTPLFCIAALALVPPYLADVFARFRHHFERLELLGRQPGVQKILAAILCLLSVGILLATGTLHKERAWTMEVPRSQYPVSAIKFIQQYQIHGNMLVMFDWGEMCMWELPDSPVSLDGRLDTSYPHDMIAAHWKFYNDEPSPNTVLKIERADYALLPVHLAGALTLMKQHGWHPVYVDNVAVVLVKSLEHFPKLNGLSKLMLPIQAGPEAVAGRVPFPDRPAPQIAGHP